MDNLRGAAAEYQKLLKELSEAPGRSWRTWFLSSATKLVLREKNERLAYLQTVSVSGSVLGNLIVACGTRMQLSIDIALCEVRDRIIQDAISKARKYCMKKSQERLYYCKI